MPSVGYKLQLCLEDEISRRDVEHREQKSGPQATDLGQFVDIAEHENSCLHKIISRTRTRAVSLSSYCYTGA